jgi:hypothetical protein
MREGNEAFNTSTTVRSSAIVWLIITNITIAQIMAGAPGAVVLAKPLFGLGKSSLSADLRRSEQEMRLSFFIVHSACKAAKYRNL